MKYRQQIRNMFQRIPPKFWHIGIPAVSVALLPVAFFAGWFDDLGQVHQAIGTLQQTPIVSRAGAASTGLPPQASSHLQVDAVTPQAVTVQWTAVKGAASYVIYRAHQGQSFAARQLVATIPAHSPHTFTDGTVQAGQIYTYWICAQNRYGQGVPGNALPVVTPLSPAQLEQSAAPEVVQITAQKVETGWGGWQAPRVVQTLTE
ncbi:MAG: fibronectin type III domain-containing protein, partial [Firmicutes bacterium]|nr:fibronectin type III domain-containing protein [Bacillota bacterium]